MVRRLRDCYFFFVQRVVENNRKSRIENWFRIKRCGEGKREEQNGRWMGQIIEMLRGEAEGRRRGGGPVGGKDEARACSADGLRMVRSIGE